MTETTEIPLKQKSSTNTKVILTVVGVALLIGLFAVFAWGLQTRESIQLSGGNAPDFSFSTFDGEEITLSELQGQGVVINFWASWCVECYKEAALLEQAYKDYKDRGVVFLGIDYLDTDKAALAYIEQYGITYPSGPDIGSEIAEAYNITGVPETIFVDRDGSVYHVQIGPIEQAQLYQLLEKVAQN